MEKNDFHLLASKYLSGEIKEAEQKELEKLLTKDSHQEQFEWLKGAWNNALGDQQEFDLDEGKILTAKKITLEDESFEFNNNGSGLGHRSIWSSTMLKIAASILLVASMAYLYFNLDTQSGDTLATAQWKTTETASGQLSTITFSDGSKAILNAESKLSRPSIFSDTLRIVELEGEAYFEIAKDKSRPFVVKTKHVSTNVLGTKFNVMAFPEEETVNVSLIEGSVDVVSHNEAGNDIGHFLLKPEEQVVIHTVSKEGITRRIDPEQVIGWKDNIFTFDNVRMEVVIKAVKRRYGVDIVVKNQNINNCLIKTSFRNLSLRAMLETLTFATNASYEIQKEKIILTGDGCN
ncbi:MAG: FecR domain-containing protein [Cyclobacteriaceae bacterium]